MANCSPTLAAFILLLFSANLLIIPGLSLKVLMFHGAYSPSQIKFSGKLADVLIDDGHIVDEIIMEHNPWTNNGSTKLRSVYRIGFRRPEDNPFLNMNHMSCPFEHRPFITHHFFDSMISLCTNLLDQTEMIEGLKREHYDIFLTNVYEGCPFGLFHIIGNIPALAGFSATPPASYFRQAAFGLDSHTSYLPETVLNIEDLLDPETGRRSFVQRSKSLLSSWKRTLGLLEEQAFEREQSFFVKRFGPDFPDLKTILSTRMTYYFTNTNELLDISRPVTAKIQYIAGINLIGSNEDKKPFKGNSILTQEIQPYTEKTVEAAFSQPRSKGVIVFSFGSLVRSVQVPPQVLLAFLEAFSEFPDYAFLWRFDTTLDGYFFEWQNIERGAEIRDRFTSDTFKKIGALFGNLTNIYPIKWLPQKQLLKDPRVLFFITHMGMNSYIELTHSGVPVIAIPILGDQFYNTACAVAKNKVGVMIDKAEITKERLVNALLEMLSNPTYKKHARRLAEMLKGEPEAARRRFLELIVRAARFPELAENLKLTAVGMSSIEYYNCDVYAAAMFTIAATLVTIRFLFKFLRRLLSGKDIHSQLKGKVD